MFAGSELSLDGRSVRVSDALAALAANSPDRLPEMPTDNGPAHGFDHNREYKITGHFTGRKIYDPNSDLFLPEFMLTGYEVRSESPGWLFHPKERFDSQHLLRFEKTDYP